MFVRRALESGIVLVVGLVIGSYLPISQSSPSANTTLVRANVAAANSFYAAANQFLENGGDATLLETLGAAFVDHSPLGGEPTSAGLVRYFNSLRATYPDMRMEPEIIASQNDIVTISLATTPAMTAIVDGPVPDWDPSVPGIERLRILDGKVVERWASGMLPPQYQHVATVDLLQPAGWFVKLEIERLELAPGASVTRQDAAPSLLIVSAGILSIDAARTEEAELRVIMDGRATVDSALPDGASIELLSESVVSVPDVESYRIWNAGTETVIVIRVEFANRAPTTTFVNGDVNRVDSTQEVMINSQAGMLPPDVNNDRPLQLRLMRVNAAPREALHIHAVTVMEQVFVTSGLLEAEVYAGNVSVLDQDGVGSELLEGSRDLFAGDFLTAHPDALVSYQVTGADPATVWFVSILPAPDLAPSM